MTNNPTSKSQRAVPLRVMLLAFAVSGVLMAAKFLAYGFTGSTAILSDALESIINVVASGFALYSIYLSSRPPDSSHPYGHGKIEHFAVGFEGALILLAAAAILYKAIPAFFQEQPLGQLGVGILLVLGASGVNLVMGFYLVRTGRRTRSITLEADGKHLLTDVYTSFGVVGGLFLVRLTGWHVWDPLVACMVAGNIVITGWRLVGRSFGGLMDEADPELLIRIVDILNDWRQPDWVGIHRLRSRRYGEKVHVDFHLILPRHYGLQDAHVEAEKIEKLILDSLSEVVEVIVHVDPCEDPLCEFCRQDRCQDRNSVGTEADKPWRLEQLVAKREHRTQ
ncbi:MAG: cation transporter [Deltaproteobacteria bacterium]|nr:MAG: cation transporter [Deltaproteobacteria bacterium]